MEIKITFEDGAFMVRDSLGGLQKCASEDQAVCYANGLSGGYNAAQRALGRAIWSFDKSVIANRAA